MSTEKLPNNNLKISTNEELDLRQIINTEANKSNYIYEKIRKSSLKNEQENLENVANLENIQIMDKQESK